MLKERRVMADRELVAAAAAADREDGGIGSFIDRKSTV